MKRKLFAICMIFVIAASLVACGEGEETTLTGMVVSVDGTVISLMEMDSSNMGGKDFAEGEWPQMPEGMEGFENFNPEDFDGTLPEGENFPQWEEGEMPEMPEGGEMPDFGGGNGMGSGFENFASNAETKDVDIGDAPISVEIDGIKGSGSVELITAGTFVTITINGKGEVTNVLVSSMSGFG